MLNILATCNVHECHIVNECHVGELIMPIAYTIDCEVESPNHQCSYFQDCFTHDSYQYCHYLIRVQGPECKSFVSGIGLRHLQAWFQ